MHTPFSSLGFNVSFHPTGHFKSEQKWDLLSSLFVDSVWLFYLAFSLFLCWHLQYFFVSFNCVYCWHWYCLHRGCFILKTARVLCLVPVSKFLPSRKPGSDLGSLTKPWSKIDNNCSWTTEASCFRDVSQVASIIYRPWPVTAAPPWGPYGMGDTSAFSVIWMGSWSVFSHYYITHQPALQLLKWHIKLCLLQLTLELPQ